jgi:malate synthase
MDEKLQEVLTDIRDRVIRIETKIEDYTGLREKTDKTYGISRANEKDISEMKDNQKWLWRTVIGGFIGAVIAFIVKFGGKP